MGKRKDKMMFQYLPFKQKYSAIAKQYTDKVLTTKPRFYNEFKHGSINSQILSIIIESKFNFKGDEIGEYLESHMGDMTFYNMTSLQYFSWFLSYDYDSRIFKIYINDPIIMQKQSTKDPVSIFKWLAKESNFIPVLLYDPKQFIEDIANKGPYTVAYPYHIWLNAIQYDTDIFTEELHTALKRKRIENDAQSGDNAIVTFMKDKSFTIIDDNDINYIAGSLVYNKKPDTFEEFEEQYINNDPRLVDLFKTSKVFTDIEEKFYNYKKNDMSFKSYKSLDELFDYSLKFIINTSDFECKYLHKSILATLHKWVKCGSVTFTPTGGIKFKPDSKDEPAITMYENYLSINRKKYVLDDRMLMLFLNCYDDRNKILSEWNKYTEPKKIEKVEEQEMSTEKEEIVVEDNKEVLEEATPENETSSTTEESTNEERTEEKSEEISETTPELEMPSEDAKRFFRKNIINGFLDNYLLDNSDIIRFGMHSNLVKSQELEIMKAAIERVKSMGESEDKYYNLRTIVASIADIITDIGITEEYRVKLTEIIIKSFLVWSVENYNTMLFTDIKIYDRNISPLAYNAIVGCALDIKKFTINNSDNLDRIISNTDTCLGRFQIIDGNDIFEVSNIPYTNIYGIHDGTEVRNDLMLIKKPNHPSTVYFILGTGLIEQFMYNADKNTFDIRDESKCKLYTCRMYMDSVSNVFEGIIQEQFSGFALDFNRFIER